MKKVYIVTSGSYSDYSIERVFSTETKAKAFVNGCSEYTIEHHDMDEDDGVKVVTEYCAYVSSYYSDGRIVTGARSEPRPSDYRASPIGFYSEGAPYEAHSLKSEDHAEKLLVEAIQAYQRKQAMIESGLTEEQS